jgi:hypothetical protein
MEKESSIDATYKWLKKLEGSWLSMFKIWLTFKQARIQAQNLITMCKEACIKTQKILHNFSSQLSNLGIIFQTLNNLNFVHTWTIFKLKLN